jgi:DNA polymerase I-like protein with 3'-5' exonuclease and polymerase domains
MIKFLGNKLLWSNLNYDNCSVEELYEYFSTRSVISLDTETEGLDPYTCKILTLQLGDKDVQFVIDVSVYPISTFKNLLEDKNKLFILQNAKFDFKFLLHNGIRLRNIYDTFLAECILTAGHDSRELGLDSIVYKYVGEKLDKSVRSAIHREGLTRRVIEYAAKDVEYLEVVMHKQLEILQRFELTEVLELENKVVIAFAVMEYNGVFIDADKWSQVSRQTGLNVKELEEKLDDIVVNEPALSKYVPKYIQGNLFNYTSRLLSINWASPAQKLEILKTLDINVSSTMELELQQKKSSHSIVPMLIEYSKQLKLNTSFGRNFLKFINPVSGRIHCNVFQILSTGRISVSEPNLNQIPNPEKSQLGKLIRNCFIPQKGYKIVGGDFSGMELRLIAEFSQDPLWINAFNDGKDLHAELAATTFDIDIKDVKNYTDFKPDITYRSIQKTINFG